MPKQSLTLGKMIKMEERRSLRMAVMAVKISLEKSSLMTPSYLMATNPMAPSDRMTQVLYGWTPKA